MSLTSNELIQLGYSRNRILTVYASVVDALGVTAGLTRFTRHTNDTEHWLVSYFVTQSLSPNPSREHLIAVEACRQLIQLAKDAGNEVVDRFLPLKREDISIDPRSGAVSVYVSAKPEAKTPA